MKSRFAHTRILSALCLLAAMSTSLVSAQSRPQIVISEAGVGPLKGNTESTVRHIATLFPGYQVVAATDVSEGIEFPTVEVREGRVVLLEILPEKANKGIRLIVAKSEKIEAPGGWHVGSRYSEIFASKIPDSCTFGLEEYSYNVICNAGAHSHIFFIFEPLHRGPDGGLPSIDRLKLARVIQISWNPN